MATALSRHSLESGALRRGDSRQGLIEAAAAGDPLERRIGEPVETDVDPVQPGFSQGVRLPGQEQAIGGQGDLGDAGNPLQVANQLGQLATNQRLASGDSNPLDATFSGDAHEPGDFLERQNLAPWLEANMLVGHAIEAANIAAIGHADAQAGVWPPETVKQWRSAARRVHRGASEPSGKRPSVGPAGVAPEGWTH